MAKPYEWDNKTDKEVVIDTNLLLDDSKILYKLSRKYNRLILPITVLQELDKHKFKPNTSFSAREAIRAIIDFKNNYKDKILFDTSEDGPEQNDRKIINTAVKHGAVLATKDMSMSIIAESLGIDVELYDVVLNNIFSPYVYIQNSDLFQFEGAGTFIYGSYYDGDEYYNLLDTFSSVSKRTLSPDSWFFVFINVEQPNVVIYANNPNNKTLTRIDNVPNYRTIDSEGAVLKARDPYQVCAIYALKEAQHVLITGRWGSGKTLLATAQALSDTDKKVFVSRAPLGIDARYNLGFLPGDKSDKMQDWLAGFMSALYYLYSNTRGQGLGDKGYDYVKDEIFRQKFEPMLINSIQGLSLLDNDTLIVDEVQLITVDYISMILSRPSGTGRLILLGDLKQTYSVVKPSESGLLKLLRVLPHKSIAYVELKNSYRSNLLEVADLLQDKTIG